MLQSGIMKMPSAVSGVIGRNGEISVSNTSIVYDRDDVDIDRTCITTIDDELPTGKEFVSVLEKRLTVVIVRNNKASALVFTVTFQSILTRHVKAHLL